ncbi:MAG TPA: DUF6282 family protein [Candidatus Limnocylindria bacterium]|jgi:hypothetical protein|nr:DUF6282 family protein [Candidatus Limnocylindria bacterium]
MGCSCCSAPSRAQFLRRSAFAAAAAAGLAGATPLAASAQTEPSPASSQLARDAVHGALDLHVHPGPDVFPRKFDDEEVARRYQSAGFAGFVIKSHYVPTAERATIVGKQIAGLAIAGGIVLNNAVGGINPMAVELAAREGARFVWMPTLDSPADDSGRVDPKPGQKVPSWAKLQLQLRDDGYPSRAVHVTDEHGALLPETVAVLHSAAHHDLVVATGHLGRNDIFAVVRGAKAAGVKRIVVTHADYPSLGLSADDQKALVAMGAWLERSFSTSAALGVPWEQVFANIRHVGWERNYLSTDLGQPERANPETGLPLMAQRMLDAGFSADQIHRLAVRNPHDVLLA